jgi:two-component system sensor histidine kinase ResE
MGRLIRQLLELARIESGQTRLTRRSVELRPFLERVQHRFGPEAQRRGVALIVAAAPEATAWADEERLGQMLDNLVGNALRHTPDGGEIVLGVATVETEGRVRLTVRDSGSGIEPERLARIFDRFERGEDAVGREGFGLGLSIVKELVQAHGGTIAVSSQVGAGTTFAIELPAGTESIDS